MSEPGRAPMLRPLTASDARKAAEVHMRSFPGFFLASMGPRFLAEMYTGFATLPGSVACVAEVDDRIVGSAVGSLTPDIFFRQLLRKRFWGLSTAGLRAAVVHPDSVARIARGIRYRGLPAELGQGALLSSISVDPGAAGRGIGSRLLECWIARVREEGAGRALLTTDAVNNDRVITFYERHHWSAAGEFATHEGRPMLCMARRLDGDPR